MKTILHVLIFCSLTLLCRAQELYYLDRICDQTIEVDSFIRLQASSTPNLRANLKCSVYLSAPPSKYGNSSRIHTRFLGIDTPYTTGCDRVKIELKDGKENATLLTPATGLCGNFPKDGYSYVTTNENTMNFTLATNFISETGSFDAIITPFHTVEEGEDCQVNLWRCGNNRCVAPSTKCNTFDNCGDNTDETVEKCKPTIYMYENCGLDIQVFDTVHLKLKRNNGYLIPEKNCENTVVGHGRFEGIGELVQVYAHIHSINLSQPVSGICRKARIDIYEGVRNRRLISGSEGICGTSNTNEGYFTKLDNFMPIEFNTDKTTQKGDFEITLTSFHTGECSSGEFECKNKWCVDETVKCDGYRNCADNSDNERDDCKKGKSLSTDAKIGIAGGVVGAVFLAGLVYIIVRKCKGRRGYTNFN